MFPLNMFKSAQPLTLAGVILLSGSWAVVAATEHSSIAQGLTIGAVKKEVPTSFCGVYLPDGERAMVIYILSSTSRNALVNVDGQDMLIKRTSFRWTKRKKRSVAVYKGNKLMVTIEARITSTVKRGGWYDTTESTDQVTFKRGKMTKTIQSKGECNI